ncbi:hypothetical protein [Tabrizicola flagellatus]|uniref:hypothetical protein n=1 Tax=Tabrizicola flagellatus TaxID=2593021 RepID=UPI0011F2404B|nr:hypothetical protein [Tabrizicola flagellatus]
MTFPPSMPRPTRPRPVAPRLWTGIAAGSAIALATAPALAQGLVAPPATPEKAAPGMVWLAQAEGGEGGEAGAIAGADANVAYLAQLAIVEGHLVAALDLYRKGMVDEAVGLSWHPEAEMMEEVRANLAARGVPDVTPAMAAFSAAMEAKAPLAEVETALAAVQTAFATAAAAGPDDLRARADALALLVRAAAHEYDESIENTRVTDPYAYHEAAAFVMVARRQAEALATDPAAAAQASKALAALQDAGEAFGDLSAPTLEARDPAILLAVAARVELALSSVR